MAKLKLTTSAVDVAQPQAQVIELRDTIVPGFMCKATLGASLRRQPGKPKVPQFPIASENSQAYLLRMAVKPSVSLVLLTHADR